MQQNAIIPAAIKSPKTTTPAAIPMTTGDADAVAVEEAFEECEVDVGSDEDEDEVEDRKEESDDAVPLGRETDELPKFFTTVAVPTSKIRFDCLQQLDESEVPSSQQYFVPEQ